MMMKQGKGKAKSEVVGIEDLLWCMVNQSEWKASGLGMWGQLLAVIAFGFVARSYSQVYGMRDVWHVVLVFGVPLIGILIFGGCVYAINAFRSRWLIDALKFEVMLDLTDDIKELEVKRESIQVEVSEEIEPVTVLSYAPYVGMIAVFIGYVLSFVLAVCVVFCLFGVRKLLLYSFFAVVVVACMLVLVRVRGRRVEKSRVNVSPVGIFWSPKSWWWKKERWILWREMEWLNVLRGVNKNGKEYVFYMARSKEKVLIWGNAQGDEEWAAQERLVGVVKGYSKLPLMDGKRALEVLNVGGGEKKKR